METMIQSIVVVGVVLAVTIMIIGIMITKFLIIVHPNEVVVLSGKQRKMPDGSSVGYRLIRGGRAFRMPLVEKASRMSLEAIPLELTVSNAYSKGGIPLNVEAIANIKVDSTEPAFGNALERFLSKPPAEIYRIAKDTLEGNLRGVLATLTPEEVNEDRLKFAQSLISEADNDLSTMGLQLDTLKIQNVSDEAGYLDSIGRRKTAEVLSEARKAEALKETEAEKTEAVARKEAEIAKVKADREVKAAQITVEQELKTEKAMADSLARKAEAEQAALAEASEAAGRRDAEVAKATADERIKTAQIKAGQTIQVNRAVAEQSIESENNNLRIKKAELEREAVIKEKEAEVAGQKAQAKYEQEMEEERVILQQKRLLADVIEPAKAKKTAMEEEARGAAASILENGAANVEVLNQMINTYQSANGDGEKVFMLNMLPEILKQITDTVNKVTIDKVSVIDSGGNGQGGGVSNFINQLPSAVISLSEQIENATGVNILSQFKEHNQSPVVLDMQSLKSNDEDGENPESEKN